jgi:formylglycine-generating enzyme required for sulfatase activity
MTQEEIIQMAKPFLWGGNVVEGWTFNSYEQLECFAKLVAEKAVKEALAQPEQEPVAWGVFEGNLHDMFFSPSEAQEMADLKGTHAEVRPLYTTPPQREFVGLTDEEKHKIRYSHMTSAEFIEFIEAKLKEKNNV